MMHKLLERQIRRHLGDVPPELRAFLADISAAYEQADADRALLERSMELTSDELLQRNEALARQVAREHDIQTARSDFINTAAHELGTPLTPLRLQVELFKRHFGDDAGASRAVAILDRNVGRLTHLVQDLLDASRLQSQRLDLIPAENDLDAIVAGAVSAFGEMAADAGIALRYEPAGRVEAWCDADRVGQVLDNLLSNAIKFTPHGGRIAVRLEPGIDFARVRVKDNGPGIPQGKIGSLFRPFSRVHDTRQGPGGTGLGLYICQGIVEQGGGEIWVRSKDGAEFVFTVPRSSVES